MAHDSSYCWCADFLKYEFGYINGKESVRLRSFRNQQCQAVGDLHAFLFKAKSSESFEWEYVDSNNNAQNVVLDFVPFVVGRLAGEQFCFWNVRRLHRELGLGVSSGNDKLWCERAWCSWQRTVKKDAMSAMHWGYKALAHRIQSL